MANNKRIWDYLGAISHTKDLSVLDDPEFDKTYEPFLINRALSQHEDSVLAAAQVNQYPDMPPNCQFLFLLNTLRSRKRFGDWLKNTVSDDVRAVAEYYQISLRHARGLIPLHTSDQLTTIHRRLDKGGASGKKVRAHDTPT